MAPLKLFLAALLTLFIQSTTTAQKLVPHPISLANGKAFDLNLPEDYEIKVAAQGLKRVRFMTLSPDNRLFVTDMYNLTDNHRGVVYILDQFDQTTRRFKKGTKYLTDLHNPNSVAFYTDRDGTSWFYLALTDRLVFGRRAGLYAALYAKDFGGTLRQHPRLGHGRLDRRGPRDRLRPVAALAAHGPQGGRRPGDGRSRRRCRCCRSEPDRSCRPAA